MGWLTTFALVAGSCMAVPAQDVTHDDVSRVTAEAFGALSVVCEERCLFQLLVTEHVDPAAVVSMGGGRIAINRRAALHIIREYGEDAWFAVAAHEAGHVMDLGADRDPTEVSADIHAGCALSIAGRQPDGYMRLLTDANEEGGRYPATTVRIEAVLAGYLECARLWMPLFPEPED